MTDLQAHGTALARRLAAAVSAGIITGHDWPNSQDELTRLQAARLLRECADEVDRLRAQLEVSQAACEAAVSKAQWQAVTNRELNEAQEELIRLRAQVAALSAPAPAPAEPVATLHDDGCFTWKSDEFRRKYDRQRAGWRMDVYALAAPAAPAGWRVERGEKWASIIETRSQLGQDFYPDRDPLIFAFLCQLAAPGAPQGDKP